MRRVLVAVLCLPALVAAGACGGGNDTPTVADTTGAAAPSSSAEPPATTADPPTEFDTAAGVALPSSTLRANMAGSVVSTFAALRGRTTYIITPTSLDAVDALTAEPTWSVPVEGEPGDPHNQDGPFVNDSGPRPPVVADELVAAAVPLRIPERGTTPASVAMSVVAADPERGSKRWQADVAVSDDPYASASNAVTRVVAVTDTAVIASYSRNDDLVTVALDPADGRELWKREGFAAGSVHGDVVVGTDHYDPENSSIMRASALDLVSGRQRWTAAEESSGLAFVPADPALVVATRRDYGNGDPSLLFLDPGTGAEKSRVDGPKSLTPSSFGECLYDERSVLVCQHDGAVTGFDARTGAQLWNLPDRAANRVAPSSVTAAWHGAVYGTTAGHEPIVLDALTGEDRSTTVGVAPVLVSEYAGIGANDEGTPTAYPVTT